MPASPPSREPTEALALCFMAGRGRLVASDPAQSALFLTAAKLIERHYPAEAQRLRAAAGDDLSAFRVRPGEIVARFGLTDLDAFRTALEGLFGQAQEED